MVLWSLLNFHLLVCIGNGYGVLVIIFQICIVWIWYSSLSQLVLCHISDVLYASISSVGDPDITWFVTCFIQLILASHVLVLIFLIMQWYFLPVQFTALICVYSDFFVHEVRCWVLWIKNFYLLLPLIWFVCNYGYYFWCLFFLCWILDNANPTDMVLIVSAIFINDLVHLFCYFCCYSCEWCYTRISCFSIFLFSLGWLLV